MFTGRINLVFGRLLFAKDPTTAGNRSQHFNGRNGNRTSKDALISKPDKERRQ